MTAESSGSSMASSSTFIQEATPQQTASTSKARGNPIANVTIPDLEPKEAAEWMAQLKKVSYDILKFLGNVADVRANAQGRCETLSDAVQGYLNLNIAAESTNIVFGGSVKHYLQMVIDGKMKIRSGSYNRSSTNTACPSSSSFQTKSKSTS